eukprot:4371168-Prorocentrum_lima.AAC.1
MADTIFVGRDKHTHTYMAANKRHARAACMRVHDGVYIVRLHIPWDGLFVGGLAELPASANPALTTRREAHGTCRRRHSKGEDAGGTRLCQRR